MKIEQNKRKGTAGRRMLLLPLIAAFFVAQYVFAGGVKKQPEKGNQLQVAKNSGTGGYDTGIKPNSGSTDEKDMMTHLVQQLRAAKNMPERRRIIHTMKEWRKNHIAPVFRYDLKNEQLEDHAGPQVKYPRRMKAVRSKVSSTEMAAPYHVPFGSAGNRIEFSIDTSEVGFSKEAKITSVSAPAWIHWSGNGQTVENRDSAAGLASIPFDFSVDRTAPVGKETEVTFVVSLSTGEYMERNPRIIVDPPARFELLQNYPNPFNPTTNFGFRISDLGFVSIKVYDVLGREVATLVNEVKQPGEYSVQWDAAQIPSGVYFCRLRAGAFTETKKLVLMK